MRIYVLKSIWAYDPGIEGIYATRELAQEVLDILARDSTPLNYSIEEWEVHGWDISARSAV